MKAAILRAFGTPFDIAEIDLAPPGPDEVEVAVAACAICHSDIAFAQGAWGGTLPMVLGHEASGHVVRCGENVADLSAGDAILATLIRSCGTCPACAAQAPTSCHHAHDPAPSPLSEGGRPVTQAMKIGAFAERIVVHRSQIVRLTRQIDMGVAALLSCGVITGFGAVTNTAGLQPGESCVVIGAGGVGLNTIQGAVFAGASAVIALDLSEDKLDAARSFGATHALQADGDDVAGQIRALTGAGADHVFVTAGAPVAYRTGPDFLAPGGALTMVGMPPNGTEIPYDPSAIAAMNQRLLGSRMGQTVPDRDIPQLLDLYAEGRLALDPLVTGRYRLEEINDAVADSLSGKALRNVILF